MGVRLNNRLWLLGGAVVIVIIVAAAFLLAIKPTYTERSELQAQADDQEIQLVELKHTLADLKAKAANLKTYQAQLDANEAALPEQYDLPAYLKALQTSENAVTVDVSSIGVSNAQKINGSAEVYSVPITLSVTGAPDKITNVIQHMQNTMSRAVLITSVTLTVTDSTTATANIVLDAFCRKSDSCAVAG